MVEYICDKCGKVWNRKNDFTRHLNKKNPCKIDKHDLLLKKIAELEKKMDEMEKQNIELKNNKSNKSNITNNNNTINANNTINVIVSPTAFGKEDLSFITNELALKILNRGFKSIPEFIQTLHFSKDKPEYHNVYIPNWRDKSNVLVFDGSQWNLRDKDEILNDLKDKGVAYIQTKYDELDIYDKKNTMIIKKIKRFLESYDEDEKSNILNKDLLLILYNNRELIEKTRKIANK